MVRESTVQRLEEEVGDLLEAHGADHDLPDLDQYRDDPVAFVRDVLGDEPWSRQREVAEAVRDNTMTAIRSCNATGKDWLAARLALWWCYARRGLVVLTGPTRSQVEEILMRGEVRSAFAGSGLPGELHVRALRRGGEDRAGILARTSGAVSNLTGLHDAEVLFLISEAQAEGLGVAFEAAFANAVGDQDRIVVYGNPIRAAGPFYRACREDSGWTSIKLAAADVPNVREGEPVIPGLMTREGVQRIRDQYGEDSPFYQARVLAEFPENATETLCSRSWVEAAVERHQEDELALETRGEDWIAALDPARFGPDQTCMVLRRGPVVEEIITWGQCSTTDTVERLRDELAQRCLKDVMVLVDEPGLGAGVVDQLKDRRSEPGMKRRVRSVTGFNGGRSPRDGDRFANRRAETFWQLRRLLEEDEIALPESERLTEELTGIRWQVNGRGLIQIESKEDIRSSLGRSPDRADSVAIAFGAIARSAKVVPGPWSHAGSFGGRR